jgi:Dinucleotide-utilizing enzymes involved in molybdopterin and thiamine biosynthesis family 2
MEIAFSKDYENAVEIAKDSLDLFSLYWFKYWLRRSRLVEARINDAKVAVALIFITDTICGKTGVYRIHKGQEKIFKAKICLIGLGGLGCPILQQLVSMGIGFLRIVNRDVVSITDLHRQYLYKPEDAGKMKVEVAFERLKALNPGVEIDPKPIATTVYNVEETIKDFDLVIDSTDSIRARYLVNRACLKLGIPYIYGAAIENQRRFHYFAR